MSRYIRLQLWLLRVICRQRYRVEWEGAVPAGPCILASRHEALWETLVLPLIFDNPVIFLKQDILRYPLVGLIVAKLGGIGVDRSGALDSIRQPFEQARAAVAEGRRVLIFPSGTRDPAQRDRVQSGVAVLYRMLDVPVVPILLNSGALWPWKSWLRHPGVITVRVLPMIEPGLKTAEFIAKLTQDLASSAFDAGASSR